MKRLRGDRKWRNCLGFGLIVLGGLWGLVSCINDANILEETEDKAYVTTRMGSINLDKTYWEDRVVEVRMLAFDRTTGRVMHNDFLRFEQPIAKGELSEVEELKPGTYDFLFIANESAYEGLTYQLRGVTSLQDFETKEFFSSLIYTVNTEIGETKGFIPGPEAPHLFLMTAFYEEVTVVASSKQNPQLFKDKKGVEGVALVRALSKVSIEVEQGDELSAKRITAFCLKQVPRQFTLPGGVWKIAPKALDGLFTYTLKSPFTEQDYKNKKVGSVDFYVPERLITTPSTATDVLPMQLEIEGEGFEKQQIPLGFDDVLYQEIEAMDLPVLKEGERVVQLARESVVRNMHTRVKARLTPLDVQFTYEVLPWIYDLYIHDYEQFTAWKSEWVTPKVNQEVGATGEITYFVWATQAKPAIYKLNMGKPAGGRWRVTLTNGKDFEFVTTPITAVIDGETYTIQGVTEGIAERDYFIVVAPRWKPTFFERKAEFYITVNGKEVDPDVVFDIQQGEGEVINGPIGTGKEKRYWIKQPSN